MDDLTRINGIGKATAKKLAAAGILTFTALAALDAAETERLGLKWEWIDEAVKLSEKEPFDAQAEPVAPGQPQATAEKDGEGEEGSEASGGDEDAASSAADERCHGPSGSDDAPALAPDWMRPAEEVSEPAFREAYPRLAAAAEAWLDETGADYPLQTIRITSRREGFRRCGIAHPKAATNHPVERFTPDELERLLAEPVLTVELI